MGLKQIRAHKWKVQGRKVLALATLTLAAIGTVLVQARAPQPAPVLPGSSSIVVAGLPTQGVEVLARIHEGGPFRYEKDGVVFGNRERLLPNQARGYYREYTVPTPGVRHRGARRIVCGGKQPKRPDACFYTADHYASFRLIVQ